MKGFAANTSKPKTVAMTVFIIFLLILPLISRNEYSFQYFSMVMLYAYWATSWNIIGGFTGQNALGHSVYIGVGAYVSVLLLNNCGIPVWIGMFAGGFAAGILSVIISYPCFRLRGVYFTLSTVALQTVICTIMTSESTVLGVKTGGAQGIRIAWTGGGLATLQFMSKIGYYYLFLAFALVAVFICFVIRKSKTGFYLRAISTDEDAARSLGVNVPYFKLKAMFISAFMTAVGGALYAQFVLFLDPSRVFGFDLASELVILSVVGGKGYVLGPMIGACLMVPIKEIMRSSFSNSMAGIWAVFYGLVLLLSIFFMPKGIIRAVESLILRYKTRRDAGKAKTTEV